MRIIKRRLSYFALMVFAGVLSSCVTESSGINEPEREFEVVSYVVPVDQARADVESMLASIDAQTRGGSPRTVSETIVKGGFGATRSGDGPEEPLYYIFNFASDEGFAVASGDVRTPPVFCIIDSGSYDAESATRSSGAPAVAFASNPGAAMTMMSYDTDYRVTVGLPVLDPGGSGGWINPGDPGYPGGTGWDNESVSDFIGGTGTYEPVTSKKGPWEETYRRDPMIAAQWGQGEPYNNKYPYWKGTERAVAGCGVTAVAQILYYHGYPDAIQDHKDKWHDLDWDLMRRHILFSTDTLITLNHRPAHENIATLFQELSKSKYLNASYADSDETNETMVNVGRIATTLRKLGYTTNGDAEYNSGAVIAAIKRGMPAMIFGYSHRTDYWLWWDYDGGHFWICDGLIEFKQETKWYAGSRLFRTDTSTRYLLHCNWGWNGSYNGHFLPTEFNINNRINPDHINDTRGTDNFYQYYLRMWDWIRR